MAVESNNITVAPWVSWRVYRTPSETRCFISNERLRTYLLLTEEAAQIFDHIVNNFNYAELYDAAGMLGVADELDVFLAELADEMLLENPPGTSVTGFSQPIADSAALNSIEGEMIAWAEANHFLYSCHLDLTYRCNQKCIHCYNPNAQERLNGETAITEELKLSELVQLLDQLVELGVFRIILSGGEASLHPAFWGIIHAARKRGFCVELYSNGINFTDEVTKRLKDLGIHKVSLSLYSHEPALHDEITGIPGSWDRTVQVFKLLKRHNIQSAFKCIPMKSTVSGYFATKQLGASLADSVSMDMSLSAGYRENLSPLDLQPTEAQMTEIFSREIEQGNLKKEVKLDLTSSPCGAGKKSLCIAPNGNIYPCTGFPYSLGNIRESRLKKVWLESFVGKGFLAKWKETKISDFKECGTHDYCNYCPEVCAGAAWLATGNYLAASESSCRQARAYQQATIST
jgi:AdoMet-dependent heme synthase